MGETSLMLPVCPAPFTHMRTAFPIDNIMLKCLSYFWVNTVRVSNRNPKEMLW